MPAALGLADGLRILQRRDYGISGDSDFHQVLHTVDYLIPQIAGRLLYAEVDDIKSVSCLLSYAREHGMALGDLEITKQKQMNGGGICIRGTIRMEQRKPTM